MNIESAQYALNMEKDTNIGITVVISGETLSVPLDPANRHYVEILKQVEEGVLTIQEVI
jgi:hypothetical protein